MDRTLTMPIFSQSGRTSRWKILGYVLPACLFECAVKNNALRFIKDGNDVQGVVL